MACLLVPAAEAIITTIATKAVEAKERTSENEGSEKTAFSGKLKWLNGMLWGGSALLALEHIWHGEMIPVFPFLTGEPSEVLGEMATAGVGMAALVTAVWFAMVGVSSAIEKRAARSTDPEEQGSAAE